MGEAITVQHLSKYYRRYHAKRPSTIMEAALSGLRHLNPVEQFWALRDISFEVRSGEMLGIIGQNGAGKSTLLQLIGGVGCPDEGTIKVRGRISALLDLGAGFSSDLTGRENVFVNAVVAGLTRRAVTRRFDEIVSFAELEAFIDNPVRTYSTGMLMRLAFSIAVHTASEVLLVDEFLSVGDLSFQAKCLDRIAQLKADGCAIVYISHDVAQIQKFCDRVLWLREGRQVAYGTPEVVTGQYISEMQMETRRRTPIRPPQLTKSGLELRTNENRFGSLEVEIIDVVLLPRAKINTGAALSIEIEYLAHLPTDSSIFSISLSRQDGQPCLELNTEIMKTPIPRIQGQGKIRLDLERLDLAGGEYFVNVGIYKKNWAYAYDFHWHIYSLSVRSTIPSHSLLVPPCRWEVVNSVNFSIGRERFNEEIIIKEKPK